MRYQPLGFIRPLKTVATYVFGRLSVTEITVVKFVLPAKNLSYETGKFVTFSAIPSSFGKAIFWFLFYDLHSNKYIFHFPSNVPCCLNTWLLL